VMPSAGAASQPFDDEFRAFDRALTEGQLKISAPARTLQKKAKASLQESFDAASARLDRLDRCVPGTGGCTLDVGSPVPQWIGIACRNGASALGEGAPDRVALRDFLRRGLYVVLWFYPESAVFDKGNAAEAAGFQGLLDEYTKLGAVVIACSTQSPAEQRGGFLRQGQITYPLLSDPQELVSAPYGAKSPLGGTSRQTFIIDPDGVLRWQETNIEFGIGEFSVEKHPQRVLRELFQIHNTDGWSV